MPRINFHQQLAALKDKLLAMAALSQQALEFSVEGYLERDMTLCTHVLEIEEAINSAETIVDEMAYDLLAKEQPMAIDLRFILSVIKINGDLERIGDQAANIAERAQAMKDAPEISLPIDIQEMGEKTGVMIRTAIQALLEADARMA
jgi:phosphate transport system protein